MLSMAGLSKTVDEVKKEVALQPGREGKGIRLGPDASPSDWANHQAQSGFVSSTAAGSSLRSKPGLSASLEAGKLLIDDGYSSS